MLKNKYFYQKNFECAVQGYVVPREFIRDCSLVKIEKILGFRNERLKEGTAFAKLIHLPAKDEIEYFGDTRTLDHRWEERRNNLISKGINVIDSNKLNTAAFSYLQPFTELIKVIPFNQPNPLLNLDENFPSGLGGMQYKLIKPKQAIVIDVVYDYPNGIFK